MAAEFEVQKALYAAINGLGYVCYDAAPQAADGGSAASFPYVEIGAIVMVEFDTAYETGFDFVARIHTRSRSGAMKETKDIQGAIYARLHRGTLAVTGYNTILIQREASDVTRVSDGSFHGVCEYRGLIEYAG
jgi:hypothetical protein